MLKEVTGIEIEGANFESETSLQIFAKEKEHAFSVIYGKNGAGKSTISRAFSYLKGTGKTSIKKATFIDKDDMEVSVLEQEKKQIYIFNEDYIDKNIRLREDGLDTIVVLGERKELEDQIINAEKTMRIAQENRDKQEKIILEYKDEANVISPAYYLKKMSASLKGDTNWAGRDCKIKGNRTASQVRVDTYTQFIKRTPSKSRDELVKEFADKILELQEAKSGVKIINRQVNIAIDLKFNETEYIKLLAKKIEKPELSEREKFLLSYVSENGEKRHTEFIKTYFDEEEHTICPFCLQHVNDDYKTELFASIEKILSKEAEEHQNELRKYIVREVTYDFEPFRLLDDEIVKRSEESLRELNDLIIEINHNIESKYNNVYNPIIVSERKIAEKVASFIETLKCLEKKRVDYNEKATDLTTRVNELHSINSDIAYYDVINDYISMAKQEVAKQKVEEALENAKFELDKCIKKVQELVEQKKNVKIALDFINYGLKYIFFSSNRLSIEYKNDQYVLLSRNKPVTPNRISVGERNAIALCYFFSDVMKGRDETTIYENEYLLVVDDPVSSFDVENRVGILSYLKYQLQRFMSGNADTKVLVMTHDIQTMYDVHKVAKEIISQHGDKTSGKNSSLKIYELQSNSLHDICVDNRNEYTNLLGKIYDYAQGEQVDYELAVGNYMRKVLEAFSTFIYKKGIDKVSTDPQILEVIDEKCRDYFENLMYRLVLHGGSHYEEHIKSMGNNDFFSHISNDEKRRTAKEMLCFMYCLNKVHVLIHLANKGEVETTLDGWLEEIKEE